MITDETMALRQMLEKGSDAPLLSEMIGADDGERSTDLLSQRNGYPDPRCAKLGGPKPIRRPD
jgi:hypothetical protein